RGGRTQGSPLRQTLWGKPGVHPRRSRDNRRANTRFAPTKNPVGVNLVFTRVGAGGRTRGSPLRNALTLLASNSPFGYIAESWLRQAAARGGLSGRGTRPRGS